MGGGVARQGLAALGSMWECRIPGVLGRAGLLQKTPEDPDPTPSHTPAPGDPGPEVQRWECCCKTSLPCCAPFSSFLLGGAWPGRWEGERAESGSPISAFSMGAWKPLGAWVVPALALRNRLGFLEGAGGPLRAKPCARPGSSQRQGGCGNDPLPARLLVQGLQEGPSRQGPGPHTQHSCWLALGFPASSSSSSSPHLPPQALTLFFFSKSFSMCS